MRLALGTSFLLAVADRFGLWTKDMCMWGNWDAFAKYTHSLIYFIPENISNVCAMIATGLEVSFGIALLFDYKTKIVGMLFGVLLLTFALSMIISLGVKVPFDYSVFTAAAGAFALSYMSKR